MQSFLALYRGNNFTSAKLITVSADPNVVGDFAHRVLPKFEDEEDDPALAAISGGKRQALRVVADEALATVGGQ